MNKADMYIENIKKYIFLKDFLALEEFLIDNSNLPGPRANLELANSFAFYLKDNRLTDTKILEKLMEWASFKDSEITDSDTPRVFIVFCALQGLGAIYNNIELEQKPLILSILKKAANDLRWRVREAVAISIQWIEEEDFLTAKQIIDKWIIDATLLEKRAIIAALAHPPILNIRSIVEYCLEIAGRILTELEHTEKEMRKSDEFRVLRQSLEYAISVFVCNLPEEGFLFLKKWAQKNDNDIKRIIKSNLSKSRLTKKFEAQVKEVLTLI